MVHGYDTDLWTCDRIARLIWGEFRVRYHRDHIDRLMHQLGWSYQKPERRALERNDEVIDRWKRTSWPRVKKNAARLGAHIVFVDESGFLLIPTVRKTWAPRGETPLIHHRYRHDRISVISGISIAPRRQRVGLYFRCHAKNIRHDEVCEFLRYLLRHLRGHVFFIWDNASIHKGERIREICHRFPRLHLENLPPYAPQLNPDEAVWADAKGRLVFCAGSSFTEPGD